MRKQDDISRKQEIKNRTQTQNIGHRTLLVAGRMNFVMTQLTGLARSPCGGTS